MCSACLYWERTLEACAWFPRFVPHVAFPLLDFVLYPFDIITAIEEYTLWPLSPGEPSKLELVSGNFPMKNILPAAYKLDLRTEVTMGKEAS